MRRQDRPRSDYTYAKSDQVLHCLLLESFNTDNTLYTNTRYNNKIRHDYNLTITKSSLKRLQLIKNYPRIMNLNSLKKHMFLDIC